MPGGKARRQLPTGTVTFLFSDIEGSTRLLAKLQDRYESVLAEHSAILRDAIESHDGTEVNTEGDSFFAVFPSAPESVRAAAQAQQALAGHEWPAGEVRVRIGLLTGEGRLGGADYVGMDVHRAARIAAAGHGGQVLLGASTHALVDQALPEGTVLRDLGEHRLKDLARPEQLWQLDIEGLANEHPPLRSLDARPNNLPPSATPLIGREHEIETVRELLKRRRLLTITGPGGAGKTRLALAAAGRLLGEYPDGAFFAALDDAHDRSEITSGIAAALGVREKPDRDLEQGVKDYLHERKLLLVLDNFEQVVAAAPLVGELLGEAPLLRVIVTSREVLRLSDEQEFNVPPLQLPDPDILLSLDALSQYESVALFIERAIAVRSDFRVTNQNAPAVAQICSRLDGLPLAIELAAARVKLLSPQQILDRLDKSLAFLNSGARDMPDRQRTLRGAIDWSYELLDEPERRLLARLAVFAGGWTLAACDAVCNPDAELGLDTFEALASMADKSLIYQSAGDVGSAGDDAEPRFEMLQVMREFATEKLEAGSDGKEIRRRHGQHMLELAEEAEPELARSDLRVWQHRLRREEENLRAAMRWASAEQDAQTGLRIAASLWRYWHYWALVREGRSWLDGILGMVGAEKPSVARARALSALGGLVYWQGDAELAKSLYEEALDLYELNQDEQAVAGTFLDLAWTAAARGDGDAAQRRAGQAGAKYTELGDREGEARVAAWIRAAAYLVFAGGTFEDAATAQREELENARRAGRAYDAAEALGTLTILHLRAGDYAAGRESAREELRELDAMGNVGRHGPVLKVLAAFELALGRPERAVRLAVASRKWVRELGGELPETLTHAGDPLEASRSQLTAEEYDRGVEEGDSMTLQEAVAYAIGDA